MAGFQSYEIDKENQKNKTKGDVARCNREKVSVEEIQKVQFILLAKHFLFYSAFFGLVDKRLTGDKAGDVKDVEVGAANLTKERQRGPFFSDAWKKTYEVQAKKYFGKTFDQWVDIALVTLLIILLGTMFGLIAYVAYTKNNVNCD